MNHTPIDPEVDPGRHRKRLHGFEEPSAQASSQLLRPKKRHRNGSKEDTHVSATIHRVKCLSDDLGHTRHHGSTLFFDRPRLFEGDNKASALRGRHRIGGDLDDYLKDHPENSFVVCRTYNCVDYQDTIQAEFTKLSVPTAEQEMEDELRPYFSILQHDAEPATPQSETMHLTAAFRNAMNNLEMLEPRLFAEWDASLIPPYLQVCHTREQIQNLVRESLDDHDAAHILLLLTYVEDSFGPEFQAAKDLFEQGLVTREHLDKLYGPNEVQVTTQGGEPVAYVSMLCPVRAPGGGIVSLKCYSWSFDGAFHRDERNVPIYWPAKGNGPVPITDLEMYPLKFDHTGQLEKSLRDRGNMFWSCRQSNLLGYGAPTATFEIKVSSPRYMIDVATYHDLHSKEQGQANVSQNDLSEELMASDEAPEGPFVLLLPSKIRGFGLHDKKWRTLLVKHLRPVQWNKKAFEQLVLDPTKKELIEATVRIHASSNISTDVIEGKGNGLIILLHGGPGTGKTLTAESVAELAEKPLYRVTCGDIGTDPEGVERYLESVLYIGTIWKTVLLLDESDVFLEEREKTDLQRNALVSVFLRALEYYEGILILTSNRVGIFDEAFKSRVQLALHYPPLDYKGRWEIWSNLINLLQRQQDDSMTRLVDGESINTDELRDKIDVLAKEDLNGRQIRNAITTARQLSRFRNKSLGYDHLNQTIRVANDFDAYVEKTHGHKAGEYARAAGMRLE